MLARLTLILSLLSAPAVAQETSVALGGLRPDPNAPIEIASDSLAVDQQAGTAEFTGNVVIGQGDLRLSAGRVQVVYGSDAGSISRLEASGGVTFATSEAEAEATQAVYDIDGGTLVLTGDVLLSQGPSALAADRMSIDLSTGAAVMEGRVRTVFQQQGADQ